MKSQPETTHWIQDLNAQGGVRSWRKSDIPRDYWDHVYTITTTDPWATPPEAPAASPPMTLYPDGHPDAPRCDCGGKKARTTHSDWCSNPGDK